MGALGINSLCVLTADLKWSSTLTPAALTSFPDDMGSLHSALGVELGEEWMETKTRSQKMHIWSMLGTSALGKVLAQWSWVRRISRLPSCEVFTYLINMKYNYLQGPVGTILFGF